MAHDLEILADGSASMFYAGETPWHALGTRVDGLLTADEALSASGLRWSVEKRPTYVEREGIFEAIPDRFEIMRETDKKTLGIVASDYKIIQNADAFEFFDTLVDDGEAKYETAGSLSGGKRVWLTAKVGDSWEVAGSDAHDLYLLLTTSHDGSKSLTAATTFIRAVCANTVSMALAGATTTWKMSHRTDLAGKVTEARKTLEMALTAKDAFEDEVRKLMQISVTNDQFKAIVEDILPEQKRQKEANVEAIMTRFNESPLIVDTDDAGTGWGAFNALTEWLDHGRETRSDEARMVHLVGGFGAGLRTKTQARLLSLT